MLIVKTMADPQPPVRVDSEVTQTRPLILVLEALSGAASCVRQAGGTVIEIDPWREEDIRATFVEKNIHGMLLTGGGDVNPRLYRRKPHKKVYGVSDLRDYAEWIALDLAQEHDIPVMGICRGSQIMNVWGGGTLWQDLGGHYGTYPIAPLEDTKLADILEDRSHVVKHLHHQAVKDIAPGFAMAAVAADRHVEAIESKDGRCIGLQFHPEMAQRTAHSIALFRWLVCEAARRAGLPEPTARPNTSYWTTRYAWGYGDSDEEEYHWALGRTRVQSYVKGTGEATDDCVDWTQQKYACPECDLRYVTSGGWETHMRMSHQWTRDQIDMGWPIAKWLADTQGNDIFSCPETGCTATFSEREEVVDHWVAQHDAADLSAWIADYHTCTLCGDDDIDNPLQDAPTGARVCSTCYHDVIEGGE